MEGLEQDAALIRDLVRFSGKTSAEVARAAGLAASTVNRHFNGSAETRLSLSTVEKLRVAFPAFPGWASLAAAESRLPYRPQEPVPSFGSPFPDLVPVREIDLSFGMGATYLDVPITEEVHHFPRAWLRRYTRSAPDKLFFAQGIGDSMQTTLYDSDLLLIDTAQNQLTSSDRIWVITYANCGSIRRLRPMPDGSVALLADNPSIPREVAYDGELNIIGRVVAYQRKL